MQDLIERLRETAHAISQYEPDASAIGEQLAEAAEALTTAQAEAEALKHDLEQSMDTCTHYVNECAKLEVEIEALRAFALKAFTIVEWATGEGFVLDPPHYDCDDTYLEGVALLGVESAEEARAALSGSQT